jgi:hypothetical protein
MRTNRQGLKYVVKKEKMPPAKASSKELVMATCKGLHGCGVCEECKFFTLAMAFLSADI